MAIQSIPGGVFFPSPITTGAAAPAFSSDTLNATGERWAMILRIPRDGVINRVGLRVGTVVNNPDNGIRISLQDLDASGDPDGGADQYRDVTGTISADSWITTGLITSDGTDGGTKRTVSAGQMVAVVVDFVSFVAGDSIAFQALASPASTVSLLPASSFIDQFLTGAWVKDPDAPIIAVEYETTGYIPIAPNIYPISGINTVAFNSGSTPDERALRFRLPFPATCDGAWIRADVDGDCDVVLYDSDGTSVLASCSIDASQRENASGGNVFVTWDEITLAADTTYRVSVKPTTVTNVSLYDVAVDSAGVMAAAPGGAQLYLSTQTDGGGWSETTTRRPFIGLHLSGFDDAVGSGSPPPAEPVEVAYPFIG